MYCNHCGKEIADDSMFCNYCGKEVLVEKKLRFFDRYSTDLKNMDLAYSEYSHFHLPPANYGVTKDECAQYLSMLKDAQKRNNEKNKERKDTLKTMTMCISFMLSFIPIYAIYIFHELPYLIKWILVAGSWGAILYFWNIVDEIINNNKIYDICGFISAKKRGRRIFI